MKPIVVDPGLYLEEEDEVFYATQKRELPDAYRLFSGQMLGSHIFGIMNDERMNIFVLSNPLECMIEKNSFDMKWTTITLSHNLFSC